MEREEFVGQTKIYFISREADTNSGPDPAQLREDKGDGEATASAQSRPVAEGVRAVEEESADRAGPVQGQCSFLGRLIECYVKLTSQYVGRRVQRDQLGKRGQGWY